MSFLTIILIAISLSMDAFSLSLAYGTLGLSKKEINLLATIVGFYHFFMPLIGIIVGSTLLEFLPIKPELIVCVVLSFIGIEMIIETFSKKENIKKMTLLELLLFGLAVSIDSFSVGIGMPIFTSKYVLSSSAFCLSSFIFTYMGLLLGQKIRAWIGQIATIIGGSILILIGFIYLL